MLLTPQTIQLLTGMYNSKERENVLKATRILRKILSKSDDPPINDIISSGLVFYLTSLVNVQMDDEILKESTWAILNILFGNSDVTKVVVQTGIVPHLVQLIKHPLIEIKESVVWSIANIAGDNQPYREDILSLNVIEDILNCVNTTNKKLRRTAIWCLANLTRGKISNVHFKYMLPYFSSLVNGRDKKVTSDTLWIMAYTTSHESRAKEIYDLKILPRIVDLLYSGELFEMPALRITGNFASASDDSYIDELLRFGLLKNFKNFLKSDRRNVRKESLWVLSNICAGSRAQIQQVIDNNLFSTILEMLDDKESEVIVEACWCLYNTICGTSKKNLRLIETKSLVAKMCDTLDYPDVKIIKLILKCLWKLLRRGAKEAEKNKTDNYWAYRVEACGGTDYLNSLQEHDDKTIWDKSYRILEEYFYDDMDNNIIEENSSSNDPIDDEPENFKFDNNQQNNYFVF